MKLKYVKPDFQMTDEQFIEHARFQCKNAIKNTPVGKWLEQALVRLQEKSAPDMFTPTKKGE